MIADVKTYRLYVIEIKKKLCEKYPKYSVYQCLAKTKQSKSRCVMKVDEPWQRCSHHNRSTRTSLRVRTGRPPSTGRYVTSVEGKSEQLYNEYRKDTNIVDLTDEIALLRVCVSELKELAEKHRKAGNRNEAYREVLAEAVRTLESVSKVAKTLVGIEATYFSLQSLQNALDQVINIIRMNITVCPHCGKDITQLIREIGLGLKQVHIQGAIETKVLPVLKGE